MKNTNRKDGRYMFVGLNGELVVMRDDEDKHEYEFYYMFPKEGFMEKLKFYVRHCWKELLAVIILSILAIFVMSGIVCARGGGHGGHSGRSNIYGADSSFKGYTQDQGNGRVNIYDQKSNFRGYEQQNSDGSVSIYNEKSTRIETIVPTDIGGER